MRMKQANLVGPAGFVSMEDGAVGGFVQRGHGDGAGRAVHRRDGRRLAESQDTRATEASVRGILEGVARLHGRLSMDRLRASPR
jgi:hypothetical protein